MKNVPLLTLALATIAILIALFSWAPWQEVIAPEKLLERYLDPSAVTLPVLPAGIPAPGSVDQIRQTFYDNYRVNDYQDALSAARGLNQPTATDSFFMALAYIGNEQSDAALDILLQLEGNNSAYQPEIKWYTALINWKLGDLDAGIKQLESYGLGDRYRSEARQFLRSINE